MACWGGFGHGQLGPAAGGDSSLPVTVPGITGAVAIAAGTDYTCALMGGGGVTCWPGSTGKTGTPFDVTGLAGGVTAITAGESGACALTSAGGVKCWANANPAADIPGLTSGVAALATGSTRNGCAVTNAGGLKCWTATNTVSDYPISGAKAFEVLGGCALTSAGGVKCISNDKFVDVTGLTSGVTAIAGGGGSFDCALTSAGGVKCWGNNGFGALGNGSPAGAGTGLTPVDVTGLTSGVTSIAAGAYAACALTSGGGVKCWGDNSHGELGNGSTPSSLTPVDVTGL